MTHDLSDKGLEEMAKELCSLDYVSHIVTYPELVPPIFTALKSVRDERIALVWASEQRYASWVETQGTVGAVYPEACYDWLRANVKAHLVPDVSDIELGKMAQDFYQWSAVGEEPMLKSACQQSYIAGFRAALNKFQPPSNSKTRKARS